MPKVSVVLPVYNGEKFLKNAIKSVLKQTFSDFELIIVDDCSEDSSKRIVDSYLSLDSRIRYYRNEKNLKLPRSLNVGFSKANGSFLTWTSCDNLYCSTAFERMLSVFKENVEIGLVYASMQIIDENGKKKEIINAGPADHLIFRNVVGACFLYKRSVAEMVGLYNNSLFLCEDYEYWLRIARVSKIYPINDCLYQYRRHSDSLSHKNEKEIISKGIVVQKDYYRTFIKTRGQAAIFYAHLRDRDIYNPLRQFYLLMILFYSPKQFFIEVYDILRRRIS